jgi:hypothetical protein
MLSTEFGLSKCRWVLTPIPEPSDAQHLGLPSSPMVAPTFLGGGKNSKRPNGNPKVIGPQVERGTNKSRTLSPYQLNAEN